MKNLMKISLALVAVMLMGLNVSFGQSAEATASATVLAPLSIEKQPGTDIVFGNISSTTPSALKLDPNSLANNINVNPVESGVARFNVVGADVKINVTYDATVTLQGKEDISAESMIMTPLVVGDASEGSQATAAIIASNGEVTIADGTFFIWVGGTIPQLENQPQGAYEGTFNISVAYN